MNETKEIELGKAAAKGSRAQQLLDSDILNECFESLKKEYLDYWLMTHINDVNGRERLFQAVQIVGKVREHLQKIAANGRLATRDLSSIKTLKR
jgi:hypothetical protein